MTAEPIARVVHDLRTGNVDQILIGPAGSPSMDRLAKTAMDSLPPAIALRGMPESAMRKAVTKATQGVLSPQAMRRLKAEQAAGRVVTDEAMQRAKRPQPVVDATALYQHVLARQTPIALYDDHPCVTPPWEQAMVCFANKHGNIIVCQLTRFDFDGKSWNTINEVDWDRVRWVTEVFFWGGGRSGSGVEVATTGPLHHVQIAIYEDGSPIDIHWTQVLPKIHLDSWEIPQLTLLSALNFLNCRNVETVEPERPRPVRRRLQRLGVAVQTIVVRPVGKRARSTQDGSGGGDAVPLSSVRGHFAHYGPQYGRGKLFGKLEGRYWIPGHARGSAEAGGTDAPRDYVLQPGAAS